MAIASPPPKRRRWKLWASLAIVVVLLLVIGAIVAIPWSVSIPPVRRLVVAKANELLAPAKVEVGSLRLSWFRATRMSGVKLFDPKGHCVVDAPNATLDRSLWQLIFNRPSYGTLTLHAATVDIERRADGSIDLADALHAILAPDPKSESDPRTDFTLRVARGKLRLRSPELAEPLTAERMDMVLQVPPAPKELSWRIELANPKAPGTETLAIEGEYNHRAAPGTSADLKMNVAGVRWRVAAQVAGVVARGRFDGKVDVLQQDRLWGISGDARLLELDATGPALAGDRLRLDLVDAGWDLAQAAEGWTVRRLDLTSPVATLKAKGELNAPPGTSTQIDGQLDLAALSRQLPHALRLRDSLTLERGVVQVHLDLRSEAGGQRLDAEARVSDLVAREPSRTFTLREPATLSAHVTRRGSDLRVEGIAVKTLFLDASGQGDLDRGVTLNATLDLAGLQGGLRDLIDFGGLELAGKGRVAAEYRRSATAFSGRFAAEFQGMRVAGLLAAPIERDSMRIEAAVAGPVAPSGLPLDWNAARIGLRSAQDMLTVSAKSRDQVVDLTADASMPIHLSGRDVLADAKMVVRWHDRILEIDDSQVGLKPADPKAADGLVRLAARGRYNTATGELVLVPPPNPKMEPIALAADGLKISGMGQSGPGMHVQGGLVGDLAALDRTLAAWKLAERMELAGGISARVSAHRGVGGRMDLDLKLDSPDVSLPSGDGAKRRKEGPIALAARGTYLADTDSLDLASFTLSSPYASLDATGNLSELGSRRMADLRGNLAPNWTTINAIVAASVEPKARVKGQPRPFHVRGPLSGASTASILKGLDAEIGVDLTASMAFGMLVGPSPIVLKCAGGNVEIVPIATTLNTGKVDLKPELLLDETGGATLRLAAGSAIEKAEINDEVSTRVLSYIAPILHQATQVRGFVSVRVDRAEVPLWGGGDRQPNIDGTVTFLDVVYGPGTLAKQLLALTGKGGNLGLRLDQDVKIAVADGRVTQSGLAVDMGNDVKVDLAGSVGFDHTLKMRAAVPITGAMLGNQAALQEIVGGTKVGVPIAGTMTHPVIDRQAIRSGLKEQSREVVKRGVSRGANQLLDRFTGSRGAGSGDSTGLPAARDLRGLEQEALRRLLPSRSSRSGGSLSRPR